jgi:hypothetical protein
VLKLNDSDQDLLQKYFESVRLTTVRVINDGVFVVVVVVVEVDVVVVPC